MSWYVNLNTSSKQSDRLKTTATGVSITAEEKVMRRVGASEPAANTWNQSGAYTDVN